MASMLACCVTFHLCFCQVSVDAKWWWRRLTVQLPRDKRLRNPLPGVARPQQPQQQHGLRPGHRREGGGGGRGVRFLVFPKRSTWLLPLHIASQVRPLSSFLIQVHVGRFQGSCLPRFPILLPHTNTGLGSLQKTFWFVNFVGIYSWHDNIEYDTQCKKCQIFH